MTAYYSIVDAKTKERVKWKPGQCGFGWPTQPHRMMEKITALEEEFEDEGKLVCREIDGTRIDYLTINEAKKDIPEKAELYLNDNPGLSEDGQMQITIELLRAARKETK